MEGELIQISKINDFIFCPYSIYFHGIYESFNQKIYHEEPQIAGRICHEKIDNKRYSTSSNILQGIEVASLEWGVIGKIDLFKMKECELIERKYLLKKIFLGHKFQLYCQMLCLLELGYPIKKLTIRSLKDNKSFDIPLPDKKELSYLKVFLEKMRNFSVEGVATKKNLNKCQRCIYSSLCV